MLQNIKTALLSVTMLSMLFLVGCEEDEPSAPGAEMTQIRVIHTSYDAPNVDVQVDGENAITDLAYGQSSGYTSIEAGTRSVTVTPAGSTSPQVIAENLPLDEGEVYSVFAMDSLDAISAVFTSEDKSAASGQAKIRFVHASPDAPAVDIRTGSASGAAVFSSAAFKDISDYTTVDPNDYMFVVTPAGTEEEVIAFDPVGLEAGQVYTVVAHGTLDDSDNYPFAVRVFLDTGAGDQFVDLNPAPTTADLRVIHTSYDAPNVDVTLDGTTAITDLAYGMSSGYAEVEFGTRNVVVTPAGATSPEVINADVDLLRGTDYTVFAMGALANISQVVANDMRDPSSGSAKVRFVHAAPDAPAVDIKVGTGSGTAVFSNAAFEDVTEYAEVDAAEYAFGVTATGSSDEVIAFQPQALAAGEVYTVVAHGTLDETDNYPFGVRVFIDSGTGDQFVDLTAGSSNAMVIHASPDAPGVDLYIDGTLINSGTPLMYPDNTGYLSLVSGTRNIMVNPTGSQTSVIDADVTFRQDSSYSIFAINDVNNIEPLVVMDDLTAPASGNAHARFFHLSPDAPAVDITTDDGTMVFANYSFRDYSAFTPLPAGDYDLQVRAAGTSTVVLDLAPITLSDGMIYTIFAKGFLNGTGDQALGAEIIMNN